MKKIIFALFFCLNIVFAQNNKGKADDAGRIALATVISDDIDGLTPSVQSYLRSKLNQIISRYGMGGSVMSERFIITANAQIVTKDITATAPPMHVYTLDVGFFIGDGIDGKLFASTSKTLKGVGETETKAYKAALKNIKTTDPIFKSFIEEGKNKIIEYYNSQCDIILKEATTLAGAKEYNIAMYKLAGVPKVCKECFDMAQDTLVYTYKLKMENECQENIAKAKTAVAQKKYDNAAQYLSEVLPDLSCYTDAQELLVKIEDYRCATVLGKAQGAWASKNINNAGYWLSQVSTDSKCHNDALALGKEIQKYLKDKEDKEWDFKLKEQKDKVDIEKSRIESATKIGVAQGENQPKNPIFNFKSWW